VVRRDGKEVRRMRIAVGSKGHPTPRGRFSVTDKLSVTDNSSPYGCCVLALTGHQTNLPRDWPGGDRLAIHATTDTKSIGKPVSLGCMRLTERQGKWLIETIPLGAPVFIAR
jgi:lipoprotein-anchoring transpeptidase ErfK/SrfK